MRSRQPAQDRYLSWGRVQSPPDGTLHCWEATRGYRCGLDPMLDRCHLRRHGHTHRLRRLETRLLTIPHRPAVAAGGGPENSKINSDAEMRRGSLGMNVAAREGSSCRCLQPQQPPPRTRRAAGGLLQQTSPAPALAFVLILNPCRFFFQ